MTPKHHLEQSFENVSQELGVVRYSCNLRELETEGSGVLGQTQLHTGYMRPSLKNPIALPKVSQPGTVGHTYNLTLKGLRWADLCSRPVRVTLKK